MLHFLYLSLQNYNSSLFGGNNSPVKWLNSPVLWCQVHSGLLEPSATKWERLWPFSKDLGRKLRRFTHWVVPHALLSRTQRMLHGALDWPAMASVIDMYLSWDSREKRVSVPPPKGQEKWNCIPVHHIDVLENPRRNSSADSPGSIKWQHSVFKGRWHLGLKKEFGLLN